MAEQFSNSATTTLSTSLSNSDTSVVVASGTAFPSTGTFRVKIESEIMTATARTGNTLTVTRGQEGTTAVAHTSGVQVAHILTAGAVTQLKTDILTGLSRRVDTDSSTTICWTLDESAAPFLNSGTGGTLNLANLVGTARAGAPGIFTRGLFCTSSGLYDSGNTSIAPGGTTVTLSCWVYPKTLSSNFHNIVGKQYRNDGTHNSPFNAFALSEGSSSDGNWFAQITIGGVNTNLFAANAEFFLATNRWNHIALTYDGATLRIYYNGVLANSVAAAGTIDFGTQGPYRVGQTNSILDDVRVENVVRSQAYLEALYRRGVSLNDLVVAPTSANPNISTPPQITAAQNDYNPSGFSGAGVLRLSTDASRNITGFESTASVLVKKLINVGSFDVVLKHQDAGSVAGNRIITLTGTDKTLAANASTEIFYDATTSRWRVLY